MRGRQSLPRKLRENRRQPQVRRVGPGQIPSTLGPHHPSSSERPHVMSRHFPRFLATKSHDFVHSMPFQSHNSKAPLNGNTDRLFTPIITWAHCKVSGCRTQMPQNLFWQVLFQLGVLIDVLGLWHISLLRPRGMHQPVGFIDLHTAETMMNNIRSRSGFDTLVTCG